MSSTNVLTNKFERHAERSLHGLLQTGATADHTELELALFTARPTVDSASDFTNELAVTGYTRKPFTPKQLSEAVVNKDEIVFDGNLVTDVSTADATWLAVCKKRRVDLPLNSPNGTAYSTQVLNMVPSLSVEDVSSGEITGSNPYLGYLTPTYATQFFPKWPVVSCVTLEDSSASFSDVVTDWYDCFKNPARYVIITSGHYKGVMLPVLGRTNANTLVVAAPYGSDTSGDSVGSEKWLDGATYVLRKFPTVLSVFGPPSEGPLVTNATVNQCDRVEGFQPYPRGIFLYNVSHDKGANKFTFDPISTAQRDALQATIGYETDDIRVVFPGYVSVQPEGTLVKDIISVSTTEIVYNGATNFFSAADYDMANEPIVALHSEFLDGGGELDVGGDKYSMYANPNTDTYTNASGANDYGTAIIPTKEMVWQSPYQLYNGGSLVGRTTTPASLLPSLQVMHGPQSVARDDTFPYYATKDLESEILWVAEIEDTNGDAYPVTYSRRHSIRFPAESIEISLD